jgi:hypothetical protein
MKIGTMLAWLGQYVHKARVKDIEPDEVLRDLGKGKFLVLDASLHGQWMRGHVPGAKYVGMEGLETPGILPDDKNAMLVFYCESSL